VFIDNAEILEEEKHNKNELDFGNDLGSPLRGENAIVIWQYSLQKTTNVITARDMGFAILRPVRNFSL